MVEAKHSVSTDDLRQELERKKISVSGTRDGKLDLANAFKSNSRQRQLIDIQGSGVYSLSALWGTHPKIKIQGQ